MTTTRELSVVVGKRRACESLDLPRSTFYRWEKPPTEVKPRPRPPRALSGQERQQILATLNSEEFCDQAPPEVYATLLDRGEYLCSSRTMYRVLEAEGQVRERRNQLRHPTYHKPELLATGPNQVWSWDITKLLGPAKWTYFYLYVILDIFSRNVVGWMLAHRESAALAKKLIEQTVAKEGIGPGELTVHADRGPSMTSKPVAFLLADLGVTKSHSRPYVSADNPYSEAHFRTLKYRPEFPERFGSAEHGRAFLRRFFQWYNDEHHHSGIAWLTPSAVHHGHAEEILRARQEVLSEAYAAHPERFVNGRPQVPQLPTAVWINSPVAASADIESESNSAKQSHPRGSPVSDDLESPRPSTPLETGRFAMAKHIHTQAVIRRTATALH